MSEKHGDLVVRVLACGPLGANCAIVGDPESGDCIITDCGGNADRVVNEMKKMGLKKCTMGFFTHGHVDHISGAGELKKLTDCDLALNKEDNEILWQALKRQADMFGLNYSAVPPVDHFLKGDEIINVGPCAGRVILTPGHSPGGVCLYFENEKLLVAGDTMFRSSFGRTDLWGGSEKALMASLKRLLELPEDVHVITGHDTSTTIGYERKHNMCLYMSRM